MEPPQYEPMTTLGKIGDYKGYTGTLIPAHVYMAPLLPQDHGGRFHGSAASGAVASMQSRDIVAKASQLDMSHNLNSFKGVIWGII